MDSKWLFESEHLKYRLMTLDDTVEVLKWRNSDMVRPYFFYQDIITPDVHEAYYHDKIEKGIVKQFIIADKDTSKEFGCVYFSGIDSDKGTAESGVFIGDDKYLNKGLGTEAINRIVRYGFDIMGLKRVDMRVRSENIRSIRAHEHVGFVRNQDIISEYGYTGNPKDVVFMSIWKSDFER